MCTTISLQVTNVIPGVHKIKYLLVPSAPLWLSSLEIAQNPGANCASGSLAGGQPGAPAQDAILVTSAQYAQAKALVNSAGLVLEVDVDVNLQVCCNFLCISTQLGMALDRISANVVEAAKQLRALNHVAAQLLEAFHRAPRDASLAELTRGVSYELAKVSYELDNELTAQREQRTSDMIPRADVA